MAKTKRISHIGKDGHAYFKNTGSYNEVKMPKKKVVKNKPGIHLYKTEV